VRLLADTNIVSMAVEALRSRGHDLIYVAERDVDPGDPAILEEARASDRVLLTKDHDIGALVFRDRTAHAGVLLIDDLGSARDETSLVSGAAEGSAQEARFERPDAARARRSSRPCAAARAGAASRSKERGCCCAPRRGSATRFISAATPPR
jgi:predicted nuclease of predicted toxin-antitoxin system